MIFYYEKANYIYEQYNAMIDELENHRNTQTKRQEILSQKKPLCSVIDSISLLDISSIHWGRTLVYQAPSGFRNCCPMILLVYHTGQY